MKKRILSLFACGVLATGAVAGMTACGGGGGNTVKLTVWGPEAQRETLTAMVQEFKSANPGTNYDITVAVCGEDMAAENVGRDVSAAADVFGYSNDQLVPLLRASGLAEIGGSRLETIKAENSADAVEAGTFNGGVYGYPYASDNTYFMYYDKSVLSESDVQSLETIISVCNSKNKKIAWALDTPWYSAGWFFSFGCTYSVEYSDKAGEQYVESSVSCDFNNADGILASKAMENLVASGALLEGTGTNDSVILSNFRSGKLAAAVTGTWNAKDIESVLGENYGVCKLPTVTVEGTTVNLKSFTGYKLFGVNPTSANPAEAHKLAAFLSSEAMQKKRFETHGTGPTNTAVAQLEEVKTNPALLAIAAQAPFTVPQVSVPANFWQPLEGYGVNIIGQKIKDSNRQTQLDTVVSRINSSTSSN